MYLSESDTHGSAKFAGQNELEEGGGEGRDEEESEEGVGFRSFLSLSLSLVLFFSPPEHTEYTVFSQHQFYND